MKKVNKYLFLIILFLFAFIPFVYAEDENENTCDSITLRNLTKEASKVVGTYEFVYDENNHVKGFNYLIYNVPDNMYVTYSNFNKSDVKQEYENEDNDVGDDETINDILQLPVDSETKIGKVFDSNIYSTYEVYFYIRSNDGQCMNTLKTVSIKKPRFNDYSELEECNSYEVQDFIYCQTWVTQDFPLGSEDILKRIKSKKESAKGKTTAACVYCEENAKNNKIYQTLVAIRKYAIYGVILGIIIDIFVIIFLLKRIKENRIL